MTDDAAAFERGFVAGWRAREREAALEQSARERDRSLMMQAQQMMGTMQASQAKAASDRVMLEKCGECGLLSLTACGRVGCPMPPRSRPA